MTVIARNPFDRSDLVRDVVRVADRTGCRWCGQTGRFRYGISRDDKAAAVWQAGCFCSIDCYRSYTVQ